jgi:hypothetical protein
MGLPPVIFFSLLWLFKNMLRADDQFRIMKIRSVVVLVADDAFENERSIV